MKVFISHSSADAELAARIARRLERSGIAAWDISQVLPGDNWGEDLARALRDSDAMVVLLTPNAVHAPNISHEVVYALGNEHYAHRVISVVAGTEDTVFSSDEVPWVLKRLPIVHLRDLNGDERSLDPIVDALKAAA